MARRCVVRDDPRRGDQRGQADKPAKTTTIPYREALQRLWVVEPVPAWLPTRNHLSELTVSPKHQLADPALATALLGMDATALLHPGAHKLPVPRDGTYLGALFESLATLTLRVFAQRADAPVRHLRTKGGRQEVDLIIERRDGRIMACEVKLSATGSAPTCSNASCSPPAPARTAAPTAWRWYRWRCWVSEEPASLEDRMAVTTGRLSWRSVSPRVRAAARSGRLRRRP